MFDTFDTPPEQRTSAREHFAEDFHAEQEAGTTATFLAELGNRPVAAARAAYCDRGGLLFGGATALRTGAAPTGRSCAHWTKP